MNQKVYTDLAEFGKKILNSTVLEVGLPLIAEYSSKVLKAQRCSIFVYDKDEEQLWTTVADNINRIIINSEEGIAGRVLEIRETIIENDVSVNPYFMSDIDLMSGFKTENIIATPIFSSNREVIGVLELLNKEEGFADEDIKFTLFFADYISGFIELAPVDSIKNIN